MVPLTSIALTNQDDLNDGSGCESLGAAGQVVPNQAALKIADVSGVFCEDCLSPNFAKQSRRVPQQPETSASLRAGGAA